jgi:murein L,D-transpeptidase YcbB/YkuD
MLVVSGCATGHKKQTSGLEKASPISSPYNYDTLENDTEKIDFEETSSARTYNKKDTSNVSLTPKQIQRALKNAGYYQGRIDGKIGPRTQEAIRRFQKANGLKVDGIMGRRTMVALNKYLNK